jgi:hypothetical protein
VRDKYDLTELVHSEVQCWTFNSASYDYGHLNARTIKVKDHNRQKVSSALCKYLYEKMHLARLDSHLQYFLLQQIKALMKTFLI